MYYRVLSILTIIILYLFDRIGYKKKYNLVIFLLLPYTVALIHTGSRGALFMLLIVYLYYMNLFVNVRKKTLFVLLLFFVFIGVITIFFLDFEVHSRLFLLDYSEGSSIGIRLSAYVYLYDNFFDLIFSEGMSEHEFQNILGGEHFHYPHNIFLELIYYYGFFGLIIIIGIHMILFKIVTKFVLLKQYHYDFLIYITFILLLSSSFSGDFSDNFPLISLLLVLFRMLFFHKIVIISKNVQSRRKNIYIC